MQYPYLGEFQIEELTREQPFCAGVILIEAGKVVVTLNQDWLPEGWDGWRVGAVGGGQEPGELIWECARREALEEVCSEVILEPPPQTYFQDMDTAEIYRISCTDKAAPFLFQRLTNPNPHQPFKAGLPTGPYIYFGLYLARPLEKQLRPGDDVEGLLKVPLEIWPLLEREPTLAEIVAQGAELVENVPLFPHRKLWLPPDESLRVVVPLLKASY